MRRVCILMIFLTTAYAAYCQQEHWYNTDSLLNALSKNTRINKILTEAGVIYASTGLNDSSISPIAFKVAYLEKRLIDQRRIHVRHRHLYKNRAIISIADYTKTGNQRRFATIDVVNGKLLFDTLLSQGSGKGALRNDKYKLPVYFSNTVNSELSSLGLIVTKRARQPENPCHYCKYAISQKHKCSVILVGMERRVNNNIRKRDIVIHTTGSAELGKSARKELGITDDNYRVAGTECTCYRTGDDGKVKGIAAYASACGISDNNGYMGQSNGCLVLPEDDHVAIMGTINKRSLIFIYSNVISEGTNYFKDSPLIRKIARYANK